PVYLALLVRWLAWLAALGIIALQAGPAHGLRHGPLLLAATGLVMLVQTLYLPLLRPRFGGLLRRTGALRWTEDNPLLPALDILFSCWVISMSGGYDSPFYEYALLAVMPPSLKGGMKGATWSGLGLSVAYWAAVAASQPGFAALFDADGRLRGGMVAMLVNPFMVGYFCALLSHYVERLKVEQARLAAQRERARLSREIHDGVAQTMFMLNLSLEGCREMAARRGATEVADRLDALLPVARQALLEVRNTMHDLSGLLQGDVALSEIVRRAIKEFQTISGMQVDLAVEGLEKPLPVARRVALYRILQESLANACKHSGAREVRVRLDFGVDRATLVVAEEGRGFDPDQVSGGHGLQNMRQRAAEAGGELTLRSARGEGTRLEARFPVEG
ncbi:MAG TPA: sensor histidine kinase, partial [Candidatus Nitrosotenuis sp.]|nr:sensor histidine kinase [Candidatus Nitrosotenuis sp.]